MGLFRLLSRGAVAVDDTLGQRRVTVLGGSWVVISSMISSIISSILSSIISGIICNIFSMVTIPLTLFGLP